MGDNPSMSETQPTMHRLRPFRGYVTVISSPVDEEERQSGLIVPIGTDSRSSLERGIVLHVADLDELGQPRALDGLHEGVVVYYRGGDRILDVVVVPIRNIVAFVEED